MENVDTKSHQAHADSIPKLTAKIPIGAALVVSVWTCVSKLDALPTIHVKMDSAFQLLKNDQK